MCRTWAPRGHTPILHHCYRRDRVSSIAALTVSPQHRRVGLYFHLQERNIKAPDVAVFVRHLLRHLRGNVVLLWDKARIHRGQPVTALCRRYKRLQVEWFPGYAPELNPVEFVWNQEKRELANHCPAGIKELKRKVRSSSRRIQHSQRLLWSCIWASALPWQR